MRSGKLTSIRTPQIPAEGKVITPVRDGRRTEYMAEVDGICIGIFDTHRKAEAAADKQVYETLWHTQGATVDNAVDYQEAMAV